MLTGSVNAVAGVAAPFGLIFSGGTMEGVESGRSSVSGAATIGDRETTMGYTSDQEMGGTTSPNVPNVPGYGDLKIIYAIVCVLYILQDRQTRREAFHEFTIPGRLTLLGDF